MAYFISTVRYDKIQENGQIKTVNEPYLCDALTCTEAEDVEFEEIYEQSNNDNDNENNQTMVG